MDSLNQILFDNKSFSDLLKEIHGNQKKKATQLASLIAELRPLVQSLGDATVVVPLIKEYMEISGGLLSEEEMDQLMQVADEISKTVEKPKQIESPNAD